MIVLFNPFRLLQNHNGTFVETGVSLFSKLECLGDFPRTHRSPQLLRMKLLVTVSSLNFPDFSCPVLLLHTTDFYLL